MRFLILLSFLLLTGLPAQAQTDTLPAIEAPSCFPGVNGVHLVAPRYVSAEVGKHFYWVCSPRGGEPKIFGFSCVHAQCAASALNAAQSAVILATAKVGAAQSAYKAAVQFDCPVVIDEDSPRGALCRERARVFVAMWPEWGKDRKAGQ